MKKKMFLAIKDANFIMTHIITCTKISEYAYVEKEKNRQKRKREREII